MGSGDIASPIDIFKGGAQDVGAMTRLLHETIARERGIDLELERLLESRGELERTLAGLYKSADVLELVRSDAEQMLASVCSTCVLAEHVSGKVRELDLAQSRVGETITRIEAIVDRASCIDGVKTALEGEDYEEAAKCVETFLVLDKDYAASAVGDGTPETQEGQRAALLESKKRLEDVIRKRFSAAVESRDHTAVVRFAKLYAPLGLVDEGLRAFVGYLRSVVAELARQHYDGLAKALDQPASRTGHSGADFGGALTSVLKDIALAIEENGEILRGIAGEESIVVAVYELQEECNARATQILKRFIEQRRLPRLCKDLAGAAGRNDAAVGVVGVGMGVGGTGAAEVPDPREVEVILEEVLLLTQRCEEYLQFMMGKINDAEVSGVQLSPRQMGNLKAGSFNRAVQELVGYYNSMEEFFMVENVRKAIRIDEAVLDQLTTSVVDDAFYILQNCSRRAVSSGSLQSIIVTLHTANNLLNNELREALQRKLREPNLAAKLFGGGSAAVAAVAAVAAAGGTTAAGAVAAAAAVGAAGQKTGADIATALNNLDVSSEYVLKLKHEMEDYCAEEFPAPHEREKIKSCLNDLADTSAALKQATTSGLEQLCASITPRLRAPLDAVGSVAYELSEAQYAENEVNHPWAQKLLLSVETSVAWLSPLLTVNNYDTLVHLVIDHIVKRLEVTILQKRFNQLGGLQLDRDARTLVSHFSGMTQRTVRDKFARLTQMATILNLEKVSEILDYWGENSGPMTWRLTPAEVRRVLGLRVDFKPEAIASLKL